MFYKFNVETLQQVDNSGWHTIVKRATNTASAIAQIANEAKKLGYSINNIEYCGQYTEMPPNCSNTFRNAKKTNIINLRVLIHGKDDMIHLGVKMPLSEDKVGLFVQEAIEKYGQRADQCGGFDIAFKSLYKRIAIVNGDTMEVIKMIYPEDKEA